MPVTAERLCQQSNLEPRDLDESIIDVDATDADQKTAMIAWVNLNVLPIADGEVSIPLLKATGYDTVDGFIDNRFPTVDNTIRSGWKLKGDALYDGAVLSYGRSEINKCINSTSDEYDKDSDQDRIQGNQRLEKLIMWANALIATNGGGDGEQNATLHYSKAAQAMAVWG